MTTIIYLLVALFVACLLMAFSAVAEKRGYYELLDLSKPADRTLVVVLSLLAATLWPLAAPVALGYAYVTLARWMLK